PADFVEPRGNGVAFAENYIKTTADNLKFENL
ncbi:unnamed protein product, partial [Rotaria sp. Silwood2]